MAEKCDPRTPVPPYPPIPDEGPVGGYELFCDKDAESGSMERRLIMTISAPDDLLDESDPYEDRRYGCTVDYDITFSI